MKSILKTALASAALLATSSAFADVVLPGSGNGELVLFVKNNTTNAVYARGLVTQIDSVATGGYIAGDASYTPGKELSFAPLTVVHDGNLSSFLNGFSTSEFSYSVIAADTAFPTANGLGNQRYAFTSTTLDPTGNVPFNSDLLAFQNSQAAMQELNNALSGAEGSGSSTPVGGIWGQPNTGGAFWQDWFGKGVQNDVALGEAASFFMVASGGGGSSNASHVYLAGAYTLSALGDLVFSPNATSEVPLPAAVWLLLSGLGGLGVVGRKKNALAAQAA